VLVAILLHHHGLVEAPPRSRGDTLELVQRLQRDDVYPRHRGEVAASAASLVAARTTTRGVRRTRDVMQPRAVMVPACRSSSSSSSSSSNNNNTNNDNDNDNDDDDGDDDDDDDDDDDYE
jgi:hypothetical protein